MCVCSLSSLIYSKWGRKLLQSVTWNIQRHINQRTPHLLVLSISCNSHLRPFITRTSSNFHPQLSMALDTPIQRQIKHSFPTTGPEMRPIDMAIGVWHGMALHLTSCCHLIRAKLLGSPQSITSNITRQLSQIIDYSHHQRLHFFFLPLDTTGGDRRWRNSKRSLPFFQFIFNWHRRTQSRRQTADGGIRNRT